ncbi:STAS domain-containing protein [Lentzea sp. JNUCC 0626]|uniref:STAS domain-containing protein n=1 Tax=Lentzea sp. JNUCC 0626 TaxID=3367513 RepID=UPI00374894DD
MAHQDVTTMTGPCPARTGRPTALLATTTWTAASGAIVVSVSGEVDMSTAAVLRERVVVQLPITSHLVVDLSEVSLLCAAGLTVLLEVREAAHSTATNLCVVARTRQVRLPLLRTGLSGVLDLHLDVGEALFCLSAARSASPAGPGLPRQAGDLR